MERQELPETRKGRTLKFTITASEVGDSPETPTKLVEHEGYVHTGEYADGRLGEVFVKMGKPGHRENWLEMWAKGISLNLQRGASVDDLCKEFINQRFEPSGSTSVEGIPRCTSPVDLICRWILRRYGSAEAREAVFGEAHS